MPGVVVREGLDRHLESFGAHRSSRHQLVRRDPPTRRPATTSTQRTKVVKVRAGVTLGNGKRLLSDWLALSDQDWTHR